MRYKYLKGLEDANIPYKEELIYLLQRHDLQYRENMSREELWNIFATYYNARDEFITIIRNTNKELRKQLLLEYMERLKKK
jgi:hypothetical protein